ncbi:MAG: hypothetical protein ACXWZS_17045 [Gemmatirosa sp.]
MTASEREAADGAPGGVPGRATEMDAAFAGVPTCRVRRDGGPLRVHLRAEGLLAAGALFEVIPVFGPAPPVREEQWQMTLSNEGADAYEMRTPAKHLVGDGINFQVNLCALSAQFTSGAVAVTVEQDGADCPIEPPMHFPLPQVAPCQSAAAKLNPTTRVGGFALRVV